MFFSAINLFLLIAFIVNIFNSKEELAVSIISIIILLIPILILILIYKKIKIKIANDNLLLENLRKQNKLEEEQQEINKTNQLIIEEQAKINEIIKKAENDKANVKNFEIQVVGETFTNEDGTSRQEILKELHKTINFEKHEIKLELYKYEKEDAIAVISKIGQIGNISRKKIIYTMELIKDSKDFYISNISTFLGKEGIYVYNASIIIEVK